MIKNLVYPVSNLQAYHVRFIKVPCRNFFNHNISLFTTLHHLPTYLNWHHTDILNHINDHHCIVPVIMYICLGLSEWFQLNPMDRGKSLVGLCKLFIMTCDSLIGISQQCYNQSPNNSHKNMPLIRVSA